MSKQQQEELGGEFDFSVGHYDNPDWHPKVHTWFVRLPHQCDEWSVAAEDTKGEAIARLETFIAEAQAALEKLHAMTP